MNELQEIYSKWNSVEDAIREVSFQIHKQKEKIGGTIISEYIYQGSQLFNISQEDLLYDAQRFVFTDKFPWVLINKGTAKRAVESDQFEIYLLDLRDNSDFLVLHQDELDDPKYSDFLIVKEPCQKTIDRFTR